MTLEGSQYIDFLVDMLVSIYCLGLTSLRVTYILCLTSTTEDPTEAAKVQMINKPVGFWGAQAQKARGLFGIMSSLPLPQELQWTLYIKH